MGLDLRLPNITASTEKEQLVQIKSYLYQLAQQLQWAMNTMDVSSPTKTVVQHTSQSVVMQAKEEDAETTSNPLKPLIIKSAEIVDAYYEEIERQLQGLYVASSDFGTYTEETNLKISENSKDISQYYEDMQKILKNMGG